MLQMKRVISRAVMACFTLSCATCGPPGSGQDYLAAGLVEQTLDLPGQHTIRTLQKWPTDPPEAMIVFIHGTPGSADAWIDTLAQTPQNLAAFSYDRLGYGESMPKSPVTSLYAHAETVANLIDAVLDNTATRIVLVGHSYGGPVAAKAAAEFPDKFHAVILVAAALDPSLEEVHWAQKIATRQPLKFLIGPTLRHANEELISLEQELIDLQTQISDTAVPTYILHGTEDNLVPAENVSFMKSEFNESMLCEIEIIDGQNHFLPWNEIERLWAMIQRSLNQAGKTC